MNKFIQFLERSRDWLESDALTSLLSEPARLPHYEEYIGRRVVMLNLDVSPSMLFNDYHPTRLEGAKKAARRYLDTIAQREPQTLVGIVDFHEQAAVVSHPLPVGERGQELRQAINRLHSGMGTNIGAGLKLAARELERVPSPNNLTVILLTDGESNHGPDPVKVAATLKAKGIQLDIIGIGGSPVDVNEPDLKQMASVVNGQLRYWFIESSDALVDRFEALALRELR